MSSSDLIEAAAQLVARGSLGVVVARGTACQTACPPAGPDADAVALAAYENRILADRWFESRSLGENAPAFYRNKGHCLSDQ